MKKIYLDQASTSYPKAPSVARAVYDYLSGSAVNVNRGGYQAAYSVEEQIFETREQLLRLFGRLRHTTQANRRKTCHGVRAMAPGTKSEQKQQFFLYADFALRLQ